MNKISLCFALGFVFNFYLSSEIKESSPVRISVVTGANDDSTNNIIDLVSINLEKIPNATFLERKGFEHILKEHELKLSIFTETNDFIKLGEILGVDIFVLIEGHKKNGYLSVIIYDAQTGVKYWDDIITSLDIEKICQKVKDFTVTAIKKYHMPKTDRKKISIEPIVSVDLPKRLRDQCLDLEMMFERLLTQQPEIIVLERRRLRYFLDERNIGEVMKSVKQTKLSKQVETSDIRIKIEFSQGNTEKARVALVSFLGNNHNKLKEFPVHFEGDNLLEILLPLLSEVLNQLKVTNHISSFDRKGEAKRYLSLTKNNASVRIMDTVCALDPKKKYFVRQATMMCSHADIFFKRNDPRHTYSTKIFNKEEIRRAIDYSKRSIEIMERWLPIINIHQLGGHKRSLVSTDIPRLKSIGERMPEFKLPLNHLIYQQSIYAEKVFKSRLEYSSNDLKTFASLSKLLAWELWPFRREVLKNEEMYLKSIIRDSVKWLNIYEKYKDTKVTRGQDKSRIKLPVKGRFFNSFIFFTQSDAWRSTGKKTIEDHYTTTDSNFLNLREKQISVMKNHSNPIIRVYGSFAESLDHLKHEKSKALILQDYRKYKKKIMEVLNTESPASSWKPRVQPSVVISSLLNILMILCPKEEKFDELEKIWIDLIEYVHKFNQSQKTSKSYLLTMLCLPMRSFIENEKIIDSGKIMRMHLLLEQSKKADLYNKQLSSLDSHIRHLKNIGYELSLEKTEVDSGPFVKDETIGLGQNFISFPLILNKVIYIFSRNRNGDLLKLNKIDLKTKKLQTISSLPCTTKGVLNNKIVGNRKYIIYGALGKGVYIFSLSGKRVIKLDESNLPNNNITSMAVLNNTLYFSLSASSGSHFFSFNIPKEKLKLLAANARDKKITKFDHFGNFYVSSLYTDKIKNRLILSIPGGRSRDGGVWEYLISSNEFNRLRPMGVEFSFKHNQDQFIYGNAMHSIIFDLRKDKFFGLHQYVNSPASDLKAIRKKVGARKYMSDYDIVIYKNIQLRALIGNNLCTDSLAYIKNGSKSLSDSFWKRDKRLASRAGQIQRIEGESKVLFYEPNRFGILKIIHLSKNYPSYWESSSDQK